MLGRRVVVVIAAHRPSVPLLGRHVQSVGPSIRQLHACCSKHAGAAAAKTQNRSVVSAHGDRVDDYDYDEPPHHVQSSLSEQPRSPILAKPVVQVPLDKNPFAWQRWRKMEKFLETGQVCVIDGANGTELQRRGGKPAETFSSGTSAIARPDLCQEVHEAYLDAGADVIISHSYSANRNVMTPSGNGDRATECILNAAAIARRATAAHTAQHAASLAQSAAASQQTAAQAVQMAALAASRSTTSLASNEVASSAAHSAAEAVRMAQQLATDAANAMQEVDCCAAAARTASMAALAASEGETIPNARPMVPLPEFEPVPAWDSAGFGTYLVVGSLSTHPPEMASGGASSATAKWASPEEEAANYAEAAAAHGISGVDMLWLEMMKDEEHAPRAAQAAAASGLPVMLGFSTRLDPETGQLYLFGTGDSDSKTTLTRRWFDVMRQTLGDSLVGVNVMHTNFSAMAPTLDFVREECGWTGALGCYPDHGQFKAPYWEFEEVDLLEAVQLVDDWIEKYNIQLVGGCCGLGPEFITAVSSHIRRHNATVRQRRAAAATAEHVATRGIPGFPISPR